MRIAVLLKQFACGVMHPVCVHLMGCMLTMEDSQARIDATFSASLISSRPFDASMSCKSPSSHSCLQAGHTPNLATPSLQCNSNPPNELLYGRAGFLWSALFLNTHLGQGTIPESVTQPVVSSILADGRACARGSEWPLMYEWHGKRYLGAAHGVAGIMHVRMTCLLLLTLPVWSEALQL